MISGNLTPQNVMAIIDSQQLDANKAVAGLKNAANSKSLASIDAAAKDFEAVFLSEMMKPMFEGLEPDAQFGGGKGEEVFQGFMIQEYGKLMAQTGQIGIATQVKEEMIRMQGLQQEGTSHEG